MSMATIGGLCQTSSVLQEYVDIYDCSPGTGFSPSLKRQFNQSAMRAHFDWCVDKEKKYMFSVSTRCRRKKQHEE